MALSEETKQEFITKFDEKVHETGGPNAPACPLCTTNKWSVGDGYVSLAVQPTFSSGLVIGGSTIPTIPIICNQCGFVAHIALGIVGLLPPQPKTARAEASE